VLFDLASPGLFDLLATIALRFHATGDEPFLFLCSIYRRGAEALASLRSHRVVFAWMHEASGRRRTGLLR
jgi:hypothetical protein